ncbi:hypothetical protein HJC04_13270 [Rhizobium sp. NLR8a]|uniref:hypothetical protein n=1 Tax=Rhizobium sp. NLR8a TaxID=2731119 RepID=UPI001C83F9EB|nr:hypothetical protein [Rhizobium sp. NLR8a]MBX5221279.1 hypothetical protein [Rhizobium sp. NLR8a]
MTAPLIPNTIAKKADTAPTRSELEHQRRVAKAKSVEATMEEINRGAVPASIGTRSSSGIHSILIMPEASEQKVQGKKSAPVDIHPRVTALKNDLSPNAAQLLSLVVKADEAYRGAQLIDLSAFVVKNALGVTEQEATTARSELERRGLIAFHDNGSGARGFYPRLP